MTALPPGQDVIRVISTGGGTKVVKIAGCNTCEEVMRVTLRKFALREDHERNYCFWVLNGVEPDPNQCRRLGDTELWRVIKDHTRPERNRLILRRVPAGEPGMQELERAAAEARVEAVPAAKREIKGALKKSSLKSNGVKESTTAVKPVKTKKAEKVEKPTVVANGKKATVKSTEADKPFDFNAI